LIAYDTVLQDLDKSNTNDLFISFISGTVWINNW